MLSACVRTGIAQPSCRVRRSWIQQRPLASVAAPTKLQLGQNLHGFTVEKLERFPEFDMDAAKLRHRTGAEYIHLTRDDPNNVFMIGFRTNPPDKTGVPHILEHTTLCGSKKYPVRDPFFKMLPRSFSTSMNAMTYAEKTKYPFDTTNRQDFKNLMSVYMDATLHPLLREIDFRQEGWRIGPATPSAPQEQDDTTSAPLEFKGVVYNEMKGTMSDASTIFYYRYMENIIPRLNNSGGDPQFITDLTWEQLRKFHADHYHPSNARLFTYGDGSLEENARLIASYLDKFNISQVDHTIIDPIDLSHGPFEVTVEGPLDQLNPPEKQFKTTTTWQVCNVDDVVERFSLQVITSLLTSGYGSPMYRALIESGLGTGFSPVDGFNSAGTKCLMSFGLVGVEQPNVGKVKEVIYQTLAEVQQKGFDKVKVDGILHQLELGLKHKTARFGTGMMQTVSSDWFSGVDPFKSLGVQRIVDEFKAKYSKPRYLEDLMADRLLNNKTLTFTMAPAESYAARNAEEETSRLARKISEVNQNFTSEQEARKHLERQELALVEEQMKPQDLTVLPTLHVKDIERVKPVKKFTRSNIGNVSVQWREAPTNGITYFRAINIFKDLPEELLKLIPLFTQCIRRLGTRDMSMEQLEEQIRLNVGDVSVGYHSSTSISDVMDFEQGLAFSGYAFDRNVPQIFNLLRKLVLETDFDSPQAEKMIRELLTMSAMHISDSISDEGHGYAMSYAKSGLTPESAAAEKTGGLLHSKFTLALAKQSSLVDVIARLKTIQHLALSDAGTLRVAMICGSESRTENEAILKSDFLSNRPTYSSTPQSFNSSGQSAAKTFIQMPFQVSFVGLSIPGVSYEQPEGVALAVLTKLLTYHHLHRQIRERGGAYGAGAVYDGLGSTLSMYSYRDPNPQNTLSVLRNAGLWILDRNFTKTEMEEAKISIFKGLDAPESVNHESMLYFQSRVTPELYQKRRELLLDVTEEQVKAAAAKFLSNMQTAREVVIGPQHPFRKELGWRVVNNLAL